MSQRAFTCNNLEVFTGWDRPLQRFFLLIERQGTDEELDEAEDNGYVFNNLTRPNPAMTLDEIGQELAKAGITPPPTLLADLAEDKAKNRGNFRQGYFQLDDTWKTTVGSGDDN